MSSAAEQRPEVTETRTTLPGEVLGGEFDVIGNDEGEKEKSSKTVVDGFPGFVAERLSPQHEDEAEATRRGEGTVIESTEEFEIDEKFDYGDDEVALEQARHLFSALVKSHIAEPIVVPEEDDPSSLLDEKH